MISRPYKIPNTSKSSIWVYPVDVGCEQQGEGRAMVPQPPARPAAHECREIPLPYHRKGQQAARELPMPSLPSQHTSNPCQKRHSRLTPPHWLTAKDCSGNNRFKKKM